MAIVEEIKVELVKLNMSQSDLARELGISRQMLSGVMNYTISSLPVEIKLTQWLKSKLESKGKEVK